jgi:AraC-like DNA-binding protein
MLQLDFFSGFTGNATVGNRTIGLGETLLFTIYPGVPHEYLLLCNIAPSFIFNIKMKLPTRIQLIRERSLPVITRDPARADYLLQKLEQLYHLNLVYGSEMPLTIAILAEIICLWGESSNTRRFFFSGLHSEINPQIEKALTNIEQDPFHPPSIEKLAKMACLSRRHFYRRFNFSVGMSPNRYINSVRLALAEELLMDGSQSVTEVSEKMNFPAIHAFSRWFHKQTGISPREFRGRHAMDKNQPKV